MALNLNLKGLTTPVGLVKAQIAKDPEVDRAATRIALQVMNGAAENLRVESESYVKDGLDVSETESERLLDEVNFEEPDNREIDEIIDERTAQRNATLAADRLVDPDFPWDESQTEAIVGLSKEKAGCLIGAAGTGKTTCEKRLVDILIHGDDVLGVPPMNMARVNIRDYWNRGVGKEPTRRGEESEEESQVHIVPSILLCAYTGQATQNIKKNFPKSWHRNIMTIHSALGYHPEEFEEIDESSKEIKTKMRFVPFYNKTIQMPWDVIIIDEASMANVQLWHELLDASRPTTRFYFIGDINQLPPPIGQGILGFAMSRWPVFELRHIHRQKEAAANRIIETAWDILHGKQPVYDDPKTNKDWRVLGFELKHDPAEAARQVISLAQGLRTQYLSVVEPDPDGDGLRTNDKYPVYDPWRDRILTCMNGYNDADPSAPLGQSGLNEILAKLFGNRVERTIIDAGREVKKFAVGYRVMATKNEPPSTPDRVTNGMTGIITEITENVDYTGDKRLFGPENQVAAYRQELVSLVGVQPKAADFNFTEEELMPKNINIGKTERIEGAASHSVVVSFNGIIRTFKSKAQVEQLQIAYASTVHKTQGSEMDTAIVIVHHAQKRMLNRESLYTAVTRATKRLLILYTPHGMKLSLAKQKIFGNTLEEKIRHYLEMVSEEAGALGLKVRLSKDE